MATPATCCYCRRDAEYGEQPLPCLVGWYSAAVTLAAAEHASVPRGVELTLELAQLGVATGVSPLGG